MHVTKEKRYVLVVISITLTLQFYENKLKSYSTDNTMHVYM